MNIPTVCGALIIGGLAAMIAPTTVSLAQSNDKGMLAQGNRRRGRHSRTIPTRTRPSIAIGVIAAARIRTMAAAAFAPRVTADVPNIPVPSSWSGQ